MILEKESVLPPSSSNTDWVRIWGQWRAGCSCSDRSPERRLCETTYKHKSELKLLLQKELLHFLFVMTQLCLCVCAFVCFTHEGSDVADQAEQATFGREGATFTAEHGDKNSSQYFTFLYHSVPGYSLFTSHQDLYHVSSESAGTNKVTTITHVWAVRECKTRALMSYRDVKFRWGLSSASLMMPFYKRALVPPAVRSLFAD